MLVKLTLVVNFIIILWTAFACADPESAKKTDNLTVFSALFGSVSLKLVVESWWNWHLVSVPSVYEHVCVCLCEYLWEWVSDLIVQGPFYKRVCSFTNQYSYFKWKVSPN